MTIIKEVISCSIIKPASPTPLRLQKYELLVHDRMTPDFYIPAIYFYQNPQQKVSGLLKKSLSKALSKYYPFAGRLSASGSFVNCNDEGVPFVEARIACKLSEMVEKTPDRDEEKGFGVLFPPGAVWEEVFCSRLMLVQLNRFSCGGMALAVSLSHRIADGVTILSFLSYWAALLRNCNDEEKVAHLEPCFVQEILPDESSRGNGSVVIQFSAPKKNWTTREIVFHNSKIAELKAYQVMQDKKRGIMDDQNYTRNELVTALLYRCSVAAAAEADSGICPRTVLLQPVNMRSLIEPPLPQTSVGNLFVFNHTSTSTLEETRFNSLVAKLRKGKMQLRGIRSLHGKDKLPLMDKYAEMKCTKHYSISSLCNFPLYDEMDFGWGRPVKAIIVDTPLVNSFMMMDTPSKDGINAIIALEDEDMKYFLADKELLAYASV